MGIGKPRGASEISASSVAVYLEARPSKLEKFNRPPEAGMKSKHRGDSKPPVPGTAYEWMDGAVGFSVVIPATAKNERMVQPLDRFTAQMHLSLLNGIAESYRNGIERHGSCRLASEAGARRGVPFSVVANMVWDDPACVSTWRDGRTAEARAMARAWDALCHRVARDFGQIYPNVSMFVELHPTEEQRTAGELPQVAREDAGRTKRENKHRELRRIGAEIVEVRKEVGGTVENAIMAYMKRREKDGKEYVGIAKLWAAWSEVKSNGRGAA